VHGEADLYMASRSRFPSSSAWTSVTLAAVTLPAVTLPAVALPAFMLLTLCSHQV
jgi:hypothetical protein